jgi:hypothetical protein
MLQAIGGLVMAFNTALGVTVAIRLLRLGARTRGPEGWLGVYFLFMWFIGFLLAAVIYMGWSNPDLALPDSLRSALHGVYVASASFGLYGIFVFTQRVFRPASAVARRAVVAAGLAMVLAWIAYGVTDGFHVGVINGPAYWVGFAVREMAIVWMAVESYLYWAQLRRRMRVGLAEPILVNRFLLWGVWATAVSLMQLSDPASRLWYWWLTGDAVNYHPEIGRPMTLMTLCATALLGTISGSALLLTFFPTAAYRRWLLARHAA